MKGKAIRLAPITPRALGTGAVEAASGFVLTLARRHSVMTATLLRTAIAAPRPGGFVYPGLARRFALMNVDGYGKYALQMSQRLEVLTRNEDLARTTLLMLSDVLNPMGHAALHEDRHWCDLCLLEDLTGPDTPYQRLSWCIRSSTHCARHRCRLSSQCPACSARQPYFPSLPFVGHCHSCGQRLSRPSRLTSKQEDIELVKSIYTHELIEAMQSLKGPLEHRKLVAWLNAICDQYRSKSERQALTTVASIDASNLRRWLSGDVKPSLDMLMHFCATLRCSPASVITGQSSLIDFEAVHRVDRHKLAVRVKRSESDNKKIERHLYTALRRPAAGAPSLKAVAREIGCNWTYLFHRFPKLAAQIRDRGAKSRAAAAKAQLSRHKDQLCDILKQLERQGIYPSIRNIRQHSYMSASVLAKPELTKLMEDKRARALRSRLPARRSEAYLAGVTRKHKLAIRPSYGSKLTP